MATIDELLEPVQRLRPRIAGKRSEADPHRVPLLLSDMRRRLRATAARNAKAHHAGKKNRFAGVAEPGTLSRRCVVKSHYVQMRGDGRDAARLHLAYLERDGVERDGSPGTLYGADETFDIDAFRKEIRGERRQFRFIVSPEDAGDMDIRLFARELMARMSEDLGRSLIWAAVNHHNTDHPHVHVVVRGVDAAGAEVWIPREYMKREMRWRAQEIATRELGLRSGQDVARQRSAEVAQERLTSLDRRLAELAAAPLSLAAREFAAARQHERPTLRARLQTLARLGLAREGARGAWAFVPEWKEKLQALGERGDIIKRLHSVAIGDVSRYRFGEELATPVEGVVRGKGLHDELTGEIFGAVETAAGETHYVRLETAMASLLKVGDVVRVVPTAESWLKPNDKVIAQVAAAAGGIYDPARHLAELSAARRAGPATPAELVGGNVQRLERLARYGLVRQRGKVWLIPPDLVAQLQSREQTHPRRRLRVEYCGASLATQATYAGPTWLDRQASPPAARAAWGFGAELTEALSKRAGYLRGAGLDPARADFARKLEDTELTILSRQLARELRADQITAGSNVRGTLVVCPPLPSGRVFAQVLDERSRRFVLIPADPSARRLAGRLVDVSIDAKGRALLRAAHRLNRGDSE
jgi:type IV secretory pathway VirD2 relaxase